MRISRKPVPCLTAWRCGFVCFVLSGGLLATLASAQAPPGRAAPVKVAVVEQRQLAPQGLAAGEVQAEHRATLKAESSGTVNRVAEAGTQVKTGDTLAVIVDPAHSLRLQELQQAVASARARLDFLTSEARRLASLQKKQLASPREVEQNKSDLAQARSELEAAQARLEQWQQTAERLRIKAPFDGAVTAQLAQPGEFLRAGDPVVELVSRRLRAMVSVPLAARQSVKVGQRWQLILTGGSNNEQNSTLKAEVTAVVPRAQTASRHLQVMLALPEANNVELLDGAPLQARYPSATPRPALLVPRDALVLRSSGPFVYRVSAGKAEKIPVKTDSGEDEWIAVSPLDDQSAFLQAGDEVVVRGNERLRDGQPLTVVSEQ